MKHCVFVIIETCVKNLSVATPRKLSNLQVRMLGGSSQSDEYSLVSEIVNVFAVAAKNHSP